jgi:hypothetical protein
MQKVICDVATAEKQADAEPGHEAAQQITWA